MSYPTASQYAFFKRTIYFVLYIATFGIIVSPLFLTHPLQNLPGYVGYVRDFIIVFAGALLFKYFFYMTITPFYDVAEEVRKVRLGNRLYTYRPKVSIIIPAWNEEVGITNTLDSILEGTYSNLEVVVINDGSTDGSDAKIREYVAAHAHHPIQIKYRYIPNGGKGNALNTGIRLSTGEIILTIDADCVVHKDAVQHFVEQFADPRVMASVGNVRIGNTKTFLGTLQYLEFLFSFYFKKADSFMNTIYIVGGAAGAYRREVFDIVGFYNTKNITEDIDMSVRIQKAGMKITYAPQALILTEGASDLKSLMKQRHRWKRGRFETFKEHRSLFFSLDKRHNKMLSWFLLPFALFGDVQLGFEVFFVAILYTFAFYTNDFSLFISAVIVVGFMFMVQMFFDTRKEISMRFYLLAPIGWLMFYVTTFVEVEALAKSLWGFLRKREIRWQRWQRKGVTEGKPATAGAGV